MHEVPAGHPRAAVGGREPDGLTGDARALLNAPENELLFSAASMWEIAIQCALGRRDFRVNARLLRRGLLDNGYGELPIGSEHALATETLPQIHKDPFDRILIAQATVEDITLLTVDSQIAQCLGPVRLV